MKKGLLVTTLFAASALLLASCEKGISFEEAKKHCDDNYTSEEAKLFDISHAGAQIIISDGTENTIKSSKIGEKDGSAIHTSVSLLISGETKGDGILNINSKRKGIETEKHLFINGGKSQFRQFK